MKEIKQNASLMTEGNLCRQGTDKRNRKSDNWKMKALYGIGMASLAYDALIQGLPSVKAVVLPEVADRQYQPSKRFKTISAYHPSYTERLEPTPATLFINQLTEKLEKTSVASFEQALHARKEAKEYTRMLHASVEERIHSLSPHVKERIDALLNDDRVKALFEDPDIAKGLAAFCWENEAEVICSLSTLEQESVMEYIGLILRDEDASPNLKQALEFQKRNKILEREQSSMDGSLDKRDIHCDPPKEDGSYDCHEISKDGEEPPETVWDTMREIIVGSVEFLGIIAGIAALGAGAIFCCYCTYHVSCDIIVACVDFDENDNFVCNAPEICASCVSETATGLVNCASGAVEDLRNYASEAPEICGLCVSETAASLGNCVSGTIEGLGNRASGAARLLREGLSGAIDQFNRIRERMGMRDAHLQNDGDRIPLVVVNSEQGSGDRDNLLTQDPDTEVIICQFFSSDLASESENLDETNEYV